MAKQIKFSAKLDTQEFDRAAEALQKRVKDIYQSANGGNAQFQTQERLAQAGIGPAGNSAQRARLEEYTRREADKFIKQQIREQEKLERSLNKQLEIAIKLKEQIEKTTEGTEERLKAEKDLLEVQEKAARISAQIDIRQNAAKSAQQSKNAPTAPAGGGGPPSPPGGGGGLFGPDGPLSPSKIISSLPALVSFVTSAQGTYQQLDANITSYKGGAQAVENRIIENIFKGGGIEEKFWSKEREKSIKEAKEFREGQDKLEKAFTMAATTAIAAAMMFPTPVTLAAGAVGAGYMAYNHKDVLGQAGIGKYGEERKSRLDELEKVKMQELFGKTKELDPMKKLLGDDYFQNAMPFLQTQRMLGLSDSGLNAFQQGVTDAGFTRAMGGQSAAAILAAGGSTRGAIGSSTTALKAARDFNLTNADQIMGRLTGTIGSSAGSDKAFIGIMAAGTKLGLDQSEFAAESRKFSQTVADLVYQTGTSDQGGLASASIAARFAGMLGSSPVTQKGIDNAMNAYQIQQNLMAATSGPGGVIGMGAFLSDKNLSNLDPRSAMTPLLQSNMDQIDAMRASKSPVYERAKMQSGLSDDAFYESLVSAKNKQYQGAFVGMGMEEDFAFLEKVRKQGGSANMEELMKITGTDFTGGMQGKFMSALGIDSEKALRLVDSAKAGKYNWKDLQKDIEKKEKEFKDTESERSRDNIIKFQASMENVITQLEKDFQPQISGAADSMKDLTVSVRGLITAINAATDPKIKEAFMKEIARQTAGITQEQAAPSTGWFDSFARFNTGK